MVKKLRFIEKRNGHYVIEKTNTDTGNSLDYAYSDLLSDMFWFPLSRDIYKIVIRHILLNARQIIAILTEYLEYKKDIV